MNRSSDKTPTVVPGSNYLSGYPCLWIHTRSGPNVGFGHLRRCLVLAGALEDCCMPVFMLDESDHWSGDLIRASGYDCFSVSWHNAWRQLPEPAAVLVDTRVTEGIDHQIMIFRSRGIPVLSIHDLGLNLLPSDIVIDGSIVPAAGGLPGQDSRVFSGPDYMILDPAFQGFHSKKHTIRNRIETIVINLGGGNAGKHFIRVLEGLKLWSGNAEIIGMRGFTSWGQDDIERLITGSFRFRWQRNSIAETVGSADLAITAGGVSAYEALSAGTPLLSLSYDELQQVAITAIAHAGACIDLGAGDLLDPVLLAEMVSMLDRDRERRERLSLKGKRIVDGRGVERISQIIRELFRERTAGNDRGTEQ
jgi:spore coat polysaccharide biosynthesis predicted glycosyltransferase SpsG